MLRRSFAAGAVAAVAALGTASGASAATIAPAFSCNAYLPGSAGQQWVGLQGAGFTPNTDPATTSVQVTWSDGSLAGYTPLDAAGAFPPSGFLMPTDFIGARSHVKTYTATATDQVTPGVTAATEVNFVKPDVSTSPSSLRNNLDRNVTWSVYAAAPGKSVYLHWTYGGKKKATRRLGRADSPCGTLKAKAPFIPVTPRAGTWRVYVSDSKKFSKKRYFFRYSIVVRRTFGKAATAKPVALKVAPKTLGR
jgi:hypothetical protein